MMMKLIDIIGAMAFWGLVVLMAWIFLKTTPNQLSGEADLHKEEVEAAGDEYCPRVQ